MSPGNMAERSSGVMASAVRRDVAWSLFLDAHAGRALESLHRGGIPALMLKGPAVAAWLYWDGTARPYVDIDILVAPNDWHRAATVLEEVGFGRWLVGADWSEHAENEQELVGPEGVWIDLHRWLVGVPREQAQRAWELFRDDATLMQVGGREVPVLSEPARTLHLALHAAQNGHAGHKSLQDLERGLTMIPRSCWQEAANLAAAIDALPAFAAGLRLSDSGRALADELKSDSRLNLELALRVASAPESALSLARVLELRDTKGACAAVWRELWPSRGAMSTWHPEARGRPVRIIILRLQRPLWVLAHLPSAARWVWHARREVRDASRQEKSERHR